MLNGYATPEATETYAGKHPEIEYRSFGSTGLWTSPAGFGTYRVDVSIGDHHQALRHALLNGINLIDTSSNYAGGGSEKLVGTVLRRLDDEGEVPRASVIVVSKGGYLQGQNYQRSQQRKAEGRPYPDLVEYSQGLEHCIHPAFLEGQISDSLRRLHMETVDAYLLHNPEYYLNWAAREGVPLVEAREKYYGRIEKAFHYLEEEVSRGRIRWYGISSNSFPAEGQEPGYTSLSRVWEIACAIGKDHHFRVIQLPMNLLETGAATTSNHPEGQSVLAFAEAHNLAVLINRPLNAIENNRITRLAEFALGARVEPEEVSAQAQMLAAQEEQFRREILPLLEMEPATRNDLAESVNVGRLLAERWPGFGSYYNWDEIQTRYLVPQVQQAVNYLTAQKDLPETAATWLYNYVNGINETMQAVDAVYKAQVNQEAAQIRERVAAADEEWGEAPVLSQMAVRALRSTAGVTSVLVGMRREAYVDDVLAELTREATIRPRTEVWVTLAG